MFSVFRYYNSTMESEVVMRGKWVRALVTSSDGTLTKETQVREVADEDFLYMSREPVGGVYIHDTEKVMFL